MELLALIIFDVITLVAIAIWASRGDTLRIALGFGVSLLFGALVGAPIYIVTVLTARWWRRRQPSASRIESR